MDPENKVDLIPDCTFLNIFSYLNAQDIVHASGVCRRWTRIARDEQLWKRRFRIDFRPSGSDFSGLRSWLDEYRRLRDECPRVLVKKLTDHKEHVVHTSFSRDGSMLATCSVDGTLKVWKTTEDWPLVHDKNLRQLLYWRHTLCARFNQSDRLLLVSGLRAGETTAAPQNAIVGAGTPGAVGLGELAVFEFVKKTKKFDSDQDPSPNSDSDLIFRCRAINEPYDVFGCWFDNESILNSQSRRFNQTSTMSDLYFLHAASEQTTSTRLFQFYNQTGGVARNLCVSSYFRQPTPDRDRDRERPIDRKDKFLIFTTGSRMDTPHQIGVKLVRNDRITGPLEAAAKNLKMRLENPPPPSAVPLFKKIQDIKKIEPPSKEEKKEKETPSALRMEEVKIPSEGARPTKWEPETEKPSTSVEPEKKEIVEPEEAKNQAPAPSTSPVQPKETENSSDEEDSDDEQSSPVQQVQIRVHTFDRVDHIIETYGRIMGLTLSPDQRYVFVHVRPFVDPNSANDPITEPIPVHDHMEIRIIDLQTFSLLDDGFVGSAGAAARDASVTTFFVDLDVNDEYVVSGGANSEAYLWDRRHRCLIRSLTHESGARVHSVAFHPRDPNVCVSASDDGAVLIWQSKAKEREDKERL